MSRLAVFLLLVSLVNAQTSCENYGVQNGSACLCPTGFGGSTCTSPGCGGDIFQGSHRALAPQQGGFPNITDATCACEAGWGGTGCNVCQTSSACQTAYSASGSAPSSSQSISGAQAGQNSTLTCSSAARVYAASQMSCSVIVSGLEVLHRSLCSPIHIEPDASGSFSSGCESQHHPHPAARFISSSEYDLFRLRWDRGRTVILRGGRAVLLSGQ
jgi:hypothetical protein